MTRKHQDTLLTLLLPWKIYRSRLPLRQRDVPPSRVSPDLLHSNRPPTEVEAEEVREHIAHLNYALQKVQSHQSKSALRIRNFIQRQLDDHKFVLSASRRLPYEIISMILLMCPQRDVTDTLCRTCSRWRQIALDIPQFWCNPTCVVRLGRFDHAIEGLRNRLERSGRNRSLNLAIHLKYCSPLAENHIEFFQLARSVSPRWKSLAICLTNSPSAFHLIDELDTPNLPQLESLTLLNLHDSPHHRPYTPPLFPLFSSATALQSLTIQGIQPTYISQHVFVKHLTKLRMMNYDYGGTPDAYLGLLEECSNLTHCAITCRLGPHSVGYLRHRTVPKLTHLQFGGHCPYFDILRIFLDALTIPQLEFVSVHFPFDEREGSTHIPTPDDHPRGAFEAFIERSAHTLTEVPRIFNRFVFQMAASVNPEMQMPSCNKEWLHDRSAFDHLFGFPY